MRALIDIEEEQIRELDRIARKRRQSRASLIRSVISGYLAAQNASDAKDAFGVWAGRKGDGLAYQDRIRQEW